MAGGEDAKRALKRRDDLADNSTAPCYTGTPLPPFLNVVEDMHYCCFRVDRDRVLPLLPPEVHLAEPATAILAVFRTAEGWGLSHASGGLLTVIVDNFRSPDTGEATWIIGGFMSPPADAVLSRHYAPFALGHAVFQRVNQSRHAELWSTEGLVLRVGLTIADPVPTEMSTIDRYLGFNGDGVATSSLWSATGKNFVCALDKVEFGNALPREWQALAPTSLEWAALVPFMLANFSQPEPLLPVTQPLQVTRSLLMQIFNQLGRAACILTPDGRLLHHNAEAVLMLADTPVLAQLRLTWDDMGEEKRFHKVMADLRGGTQQGLPDPFLLPRTGERGPLVLQLAPMDPKVAELGAALLLISDPGSRREPARMGLLQLLNLTPAEARVASLVGSGLPPREAGVRLGLTEATVRSTLKVVFSKLGVRRQSELVQLVGRLDPG